MIPDDCVYSKSHVWVRVRPDLVEVGVTEPLLRKIGPVIGVELPDADDELKRELPLGELEGLNATHVLYPPAEGRVVAVNQELVWNQSKLMADPYGRGWLVKVQVHDPTELKALFASALYRKFAQDNLGEEYVDAR